MKLEKIIRGRGKERLENNNEEEKGGKAGFPAIDRGGGAVLGKRGGER